MSCIIREIRQGEYPVLVDFLYEAIFVPAGSPAPPRAILQQPELQVYLAHFGAEKDDTGLVAEVDGKIVGAVWARIMKDYGHLDDDTPSLAISVAKTHRGAGIGTALLKEMLSVLRKRGYRRTSLAVQKENYAVKLYQRAGFEVVVERGTEYLMVCSLAAAGLEKNKNEGDL